MPRLKQRSEMIEELALAGIIISSYHRRSFLPPAVLHRASARPHPRLDVEPRVALPLPQPRRSPASKWRFERRFFLPRYPRRLTSFVFSRLPLRGPIFAFSDTQATDATAVSVPPSIDFRRGNGNGRRDRERNPSFRGRNSRRDKGLPDFACILFHSRADLRRKAVD